MSYALQIFQPPPAVRPLRLDDVLSLMEGMYDQAPTQGTTTYRDLVRLIKASVSTAQRGEWLEALAADDTSAVFNMAVETGRADQLVALVVRCARSMRLAVLDQQAAIAHWPDGTEIRFPPREPAPAFRRR